MSQKTATVALIFGIIGRDLAGYMFYESKFLPGPEAPTDETGSIQNIWYVNETNPFGITVNTGSFSYLHPLSVEVNVSSGENLYVLYTGYLRFADGGEHAIFRIYIDGIYTEPVLRASRINTTGIERIPLCMQYFDTAITAGTHNISLWGYMFIGASSEIFYNTLLVQTFI